MKELINKYLSGTANRSEQASLLAWLRKKENRKYFNNQKLAWRKGLDHQQLPKGSENSWIAIQDHLLQNSYDGWQGAQKISWLFKIAAIFFFIVSLGSAIYFISNQQSSEVFTTVVAENGQISKVVLPDNSVAWLNSGSELTYSNYYLSENRNIELTGEAYFEVTRNEEIPLIVSSGEMRVRVLGTKFNVDAYPESEKITVVLVEGKVELLSSESETFNYRMKPGEKATFSKNNRKLEVGKTNVSRYTSWKEGMIHIYDQSLEEVVERLENRFNQKFTYEESVKDFPFTFTIKNESLDDVIHLMEKVAPIKAEQKGDVITFKMDRKRKVDR